jgi:thiamine-monophosphate kinase
MIAENSFLENLTRQFRRSPLELNKLLESDAEILRLDSGMLLAATVDTLSEELSTGLYADPYLAGWMVVMATLSDLGAVGALPLGLLLSEVLPAEYDPASLAALQSGIQEACALCGTFVLGGDTNTGRDLLLTGCALGILPGGTFMSRRGSTPGDLLYATHTLGAGNAFALSRFTDASSSPAGYRPVARVKEGCLLRQFASACMDTSDGVIATLDQLMRVNSVGFELKDPWQDILSTEAAGVSERSGISPWLFLAGHHGEFELLFTVPPRKEEEMLRAAGMAGWKPVHVGRARADAEIRIPIGGRLAGIDTAVVRNLAWTATHDVHAYINALVAYDKELRKG